MKLGETKKLVVRVSKAGTFSPGSFSSLVLAQLRLGFPVPPLEHLFVPDVLHCGTRRA